MRYRYMILEYRESNVVADIQNLLDDAGANGWRLVKILEDDRVLVLEATESEFFTGGRQ